MTSQPDKKVIFNFCKVCFHQADEVSQICNHLKRGGLCKGDVSKEAHEIVDTESQEVKHESSEYHCQGGPLSIPFVCEATKFNFFTKKSRSQSDTTLGECVRAVYNYATLKVCSCFISF